MSSPSVTPSPFSSGLPSAPALPRSYTSILSLRNLFLISSSSSSSSPAISFSTRLGGVLPSLASSPSNIFTKSTPAKEMLLPVPRCRRAERAKALTLVLGGSRGLIAARVAGGEATAAAGGFATAVEVRLCLLALPPTGNRACPAYVLNGFEGAGDSGDRRTGQMRSRVRSILPTGDPSFGEEGAGRCVGFVAWDVGLIGGLSGS